MHSHSSTTPTLRRVEDTPSKAVAEPQHELEELHRTAGNRAVGDLLRSTGRADVGASSTGGGAPIPAAARAAMEARFGCELSEVRVHTDSAAREAAAALGAEAFTSGTDIWFGSLEGPDRQGVTRARARARGAAGAGRHERTSGVGR